jgi:phage shock protein C
MEKRLYKSSTDKMIDGVCGGIAEYLQVDPVLIRVVAVISIFFGGAGVIAYIVAAIIMPTKENSIKKAANETVYERKTDKSNSTNANEYSAEQNSASSSESEQKTDDSMQYKETKHKSNKDARVLLGLGLIGFGAYFFLRQFISWLNFSFVIAAVFIVLGIYLIIKRNGEK